jgi:hypothetical protein
MSENDKTLLHGILAALSAMVGTLVAILIIILLNS